MMKRICCLLLFLLVLPSCHQALPTAPQGSTLTIIANPTFIAVNGDCSIVSVIIIEPAGTPVPDGTAVQFLSNLGKVDERGRTNDGIARVNFCSDSRSGTARINAFSGAATGNVEVTIGATRPSRVLLVALNSQIRLDLGETAADFKATVLDSSGNPVASIPVRFSVVDSPSLDRILDGPDRTTNNNGEAFGRVRTTRTTAGTIRIRVDVLAGTAISDEKTIAVINP